MGRILERCANLALLALIGISSGGCNDGGGITGTAQRNSETGLHLIAPVQQIRPPASMENSAIDGINWINYRRVQMGLPMLAYSRAVSVAATKHSDYQSTNNVVAHSEIEGKPDFFGTKLADRFAASGVTMRPESFAYGEVISGTKNNSGAFLADELITAIYHRYVIFEPTFTEIGAGSRTGSNNYTIFTADFVSTNGHGPGLPLGKIAVWPYASQESVARSFLSNREEPDPVPDTDEVGYPISAHVNLTDTLTVSSFSVRPRAGNALAVKLFDHANDARTPQSAAAIIPLRPLASKTTYDVTLVGAVAGNPVNISWSFTTK